VTGIQGGHIRKTPPGYGGYPQVSLAGSGRKPEGHRVYNLVAAAFLGPKPPGLEVCHDDGDASNTAADNLRYDTRTANERDKQLHGTHHNSVKTHCPKKHEYTPANTYINPNGSRECRICKRKRSRRRHRTTSPAATHTSSRSRI
jgi:hypothetical protein